MAIKIFQRISRMKGFNGRSPNAKDASSDAKEYSILVQRIKMATYDTSMSDHDILDLINEIEKRHQAYGDMEGIVYCLYGIFYTHTSRELQKKALGAAILIKGRDSVYRHVSNQTLLYCLTDDAIERSSLAFSVLEMEPFERRKDYSCQDHLIGSGYE